jgi:signal transduction histidine kinase
MLRSMARTRSITRFDVLVAALVTAFGLLLMVLNVVSPDPGKEASSWIVVPAFLLVTVPVLWRGAAPLQATAVVAVAMGVNVALDEAVRCGVAFPLVWLLVFACGARLDGREAQAGLGLGLLALVLMTLNDGAVGPDVLPFFAPVTAVVWGIGRVVHSRGRMVEELQARTAELRRTRDERAKLEVATDRARLSGELDELLQRRLGELARLADDGARETDGGAAAATLVDIETRSRQTLEEMRAVVGVLRHDEDGTAPTAPQPTLTHLEALIVRAKGSGAKLRVEGSPRVLPAGVELSAYRVVEHLLDALDDADGVVVTVHFADDALELKVAGPARRRGDAGTAIERARERVELHRGTLVASTRGGRAEAVANLPVLAGV